MKPSASVLVAVLAALLVGACSADASNDTPATDTGTALSEDAGTEPDTTASADTTPEPEPCYYPSSGGPLAMDYLKTLPDWYWDKAYLGDGTPTTFDLYDFHCSEEWDAYDTLVIIVSAGWCPNCPSYLQTVASMQQELEAEGALVLIIEAQDNQYYPADTEYAQQHISSIIGDTPSIRVGDADTLPTANAVNNQPTLYAFPSAYVVRRRDMQVITAQNLSNYVLPFVHIARDPEADWSDPQIPFDSNCAEGDEETYEPNDEPDAAAPIEPGTFTGGICSPAPDFYQIDIEGQWRLDLEFTHRTGDLDVYVWDMAAGRPEVDAQGYDIGGASATDNESFTYTGPAIIAVVGWQGASAPYTLTLTEL